MMGCKKDREQGRAHTPNRFSLLVRMAWDFGENRDYEKRDFYRATPTYIGDDSDENQDALNGGFLMSTVNLSIDETRDLESNDGL